MQSDAGGTAGQTPTRTNSVPSDQIKRDTEKDSILSLIDNQTLRTSPFGDNISAENLYSRAERISAAVHLVTAHVREDEPTRTVIREESLHLLTHALALRGELRAPASENVRKMQASLRTIISLVRVLGVSGHVSPQNVTVLVEALDEAGNLIITSQRSALAESVPLSKNDFAPQSPSPRKQSGSVRLQKTSAIRQRGSSRSVGTISVKDSGVQKDINTSRTARITDILRTGGALGIKDISSNLPEYSEKMIQRDLAVLVGQGMVKKTGAKRWSRYEVIQ